MRRLTAYAGKRFYFMAQRAPGNDREPGKPAMKRQARESRQVFALPEISDM
jgi:hypothetical protein